MPKLGRSDIFNTIISWGARILFAVAIVVLSVLSFVDSIEISPDVRNITIIALVAAVLNYAVWESFYNQQYEKQLATDLTNTNYCIHKRYYLARKGWKYKDLQDKISQYNKDFTDAWERDIEDITGYSIEEMRACTYKGHSHKFLIWRIKHHKYPKSGIRTPNDVLYILNVGKSDRMKVHVKAQEHYRAYKRASKVITLILSTFLIASFAYSFITEGFDKAIITLILNIALLFMTLFFGATAGIKGGKLKLSTAEIISERLEEWKEQVPEEEPFKAPIEKVLDELREECKPKSTIEIR